MLDNEKFNVDQIIVIQNFINEVGKNLKDLHLNIIKYNDELQKENFPATLNLLPKISFKINTINKILKQNNEVKINYLENEISKITIWLDNQKDIKLQENKKIKYKEFFLDNLYDKSKLKTLEVEGRFPDFHCNNFKFKLDERKFSLKLLYGGDEEKMKIFEDWNLENILNYIYEFYEYFKNINLENELKQIYESYMNCLKNKELGDGWVSIIDIMSEYVKIKQNINYELVYPERVWFSFLIYKISENHGVGNIGKRTATHGAASKSDEHLWIPIKTKDLIGENIMYLSFKKNI